MRAASTAMSKQSDGELRRQHRDRRFAVAAVQRLQQVGLLGLGGQTGRRAAALHVDDEQRQLHHHAEADGLGLERDAGTRRAGDAERAAVGRAERGADARDLVLGLEGQDVEVLVLGQLVQDVRCRRDRVGAEHHLRVGQLTGRRRGRRPARCCRRSAGTRRTSASPVPPRRWWRTPRWSRRSSSRPCSASTLASATSGLRANFSRMNASLCSSSRPYIHDSRPSANMFLARWPSFLVAPIGLDGAQRQRGHRDGLHDVVGQFVGLERVGLVADLGEVALGELVGVGDDQAAARQVADVGLERGGVHRDEHVGPVACGEDVEVGDLDLERRDAGQRALWCADLGGVIRLRRKVIAEQRGFGGEPVTGQLHAVAGVTGESDDDLLELLPRGWRRCRFDPRPLPFTLSSGCVIPSRNRGRCARRAVG